MMLEYKGYPDRFVTTLANQVIHIVDANKNTVSNYNDNKNGWPRICNNSQFGNAKVVLYSISEYQEDKNIIAVHYYPVTCITDKSYTNANPLVIIEKDSNIKDSMKNMRSYKEGSLKYYYHDLIVKEFFNYKNPIVCGRVRNHVIEQYFIHNNQDITLAKKKIIENIKERMLEVTFIPYELDKVIITNPYLHGRCNIYHRPQIFEFDYNNEITEHNENNEQPQAQNNIDAMNTISFEEALERFS